MALSEAIEREVKDIFATTWQERDGQKVPEAEDIKLGNDAVKFQATVLYADLAESTNLVDGYKAWFAAEVYKSRSGRRPSNNRRFAVALRRHFPSPRDHQAVGNI